MNEKTTKQIYHKTDTHWNNIGSILAYLQIIDHLSKIYHFQPLTLDDYNISFFDKHRGGDLASFISATYKFSDQDVLVSLKDESMHKLPTQSQKVGKILIYHDSFLDPLSNRSIKGYLLRYFNNVIFKTADKFFDKNFIEKEKPDVVLYEVVERGL